MRPLVYAALLAAAPSIAFAGKATAPGVPPAAPASAKAPAAPAPAPVESGSNVSIPFTKYTLDNGLEVILSEDHRLPIVSVNVWYHAGAFNEQPGRTGFAHLFEHMMFQGSRNVDDDVHLSLLQNLGATDVNGTTNLDRTNYFETVPSHHLETALWLESDRMGFLLDTLTAEKLARQQEVVKNERRERYEAAPYGLAAEKAWQALFPAPHPYYGRVIGSMEDLDAATLEDVSSFFETWYAPSNATLAVVGDFDPETIRGTIEKYFGTLPSRPKPQAPAVAPVELTSTVELRVDEPVATLPKLQVYWLSPAIFQEGDADADVLAIALSGGKSSRLYKRLVREKKVAQSVSAWQQSHGAQSVFVIDAVARPGVSTDRLLAEVDAVLDEVRAQGISAREVRQARNKIETGAIAGLQSVGGWGGKADQLQTYNHFLGEPGKSEWDLERYEAVTSADLQEFARGVLDPSRRVILHATPASGPAKGAPAVAPAPAPGAKAAPAPAAKAKAASTAAPAPAPAVKGGR